MNTANELPILGLEPHIKGYGMEAFTLEVFDVDDELNTRLPADLTDAIISLKVFTATNKLAFEFKTGYGLTSTTAPIELSGENLIVFPEIPVLDLPVSVYNVILSIEQNGFKRPYAVDVWPVVLTETEKYCCNG